MYIGAHMSTGGGLWRAIERAAEVEATALQLFVKSARQWRPPPLDPEAAERFREALAASGLGPYTMAHGSYLINLAAPNPAVRKRSYAALELELERCDALDVPFLVLHPGSHTGEGEADGMTRIVEALDRLLEPPADRERRFRCTLLLENMAGQGSVIGHRFEQLGELLDRARHDEALGVCVDTCHALAAGYDIRDADGVTAMLTELDAHVGIERVRALHLNDSQHPLGSRKDRHAHIGDGHIGLEGFRCLLNDPRLAAVPMCIETPKDDPDADRRNLDALRSLVGRAAAPAAT